MFRPFDTILVAVMVVTAAFTYKTKHDAERRLHEVRGLYAAILHEEEMITLLQADWSFLSQPERLQNLVSVYYSELELFPSQPYQDVNANDIPQKENRISTLLSSPLPIHKMYDQTNGGNILQ